MKHNFFKPRGLQSTVMLAFFGVSVSIMLVVGIVLYARFSSVARQEMVQSTQALMKQAGESLEDYLVSMRQISDTAYYNVIKEHDISDETQEIQEGLNLIYETNSDNLRSIAVYNRYGSLVLAEPVASQKEDPNVTRQAWFGQAVEEVENMHFSIPHVQNLFDDGTRRYYWVISLSRMVELTDGGDSQMGVLLVDMDYSGISRMMDQMNTFDNGQYFYLCDSDGQIIYHPRQVQISKGIFRENSGEIASYREGVYDEVFEGERRSIVVDTVSYTGWKLVGVIPHSASTHDLVNMRYFVVLLMLLMAMMLIVVNRLVSERISRPILRLNDSVVEYEAGKAAEIYIGGSMEIRHLGYSIQQSYERIDTLMNKIVAEQEERRKSELEALQSQINPHFLYNALESITWMVEGERNDEAVFMISQLAKFFRISLSGGHTVISLKDELQHAQSYMNIQKVRYKNSFSTVFDVDPDVCSCCTVKLVLQPILENAINYGVGGMDDCGEIRVEGKKQEGGIVLSVTDNGLGMTEEEVGLLLADNHRVHKHGSGVGLINVNNRIRILFGEEYGLRISSEPDEGTTVFVCLPAIPYTEENRDALEKGRRWSGDE